MSQANRVVSADENRDPVSGEPGAHPVGVGVGAAGGASIGAAVGLMAGPVGAAVGAAVGGLVGGLAGKTVAEGVNPTAEDTYWGANYASRPYVKAGTPYRHYQPAYRLGWEARSRYSGLDWDKAEPRLREEWISTGDTGVDWVEVRPAVRDAWERTVTLQRNSKI